MIGHLSLQVRDVEASVRFYTAVFSATGVRESMRYDDGNGPVVGLCGPDGHPQLWFGPLVDDGARPVHLALAAPSREAVDEAHRAARAAGGEILDEPRVWPEYHPGYHGVFLRDPDGNNVEAVHHDAAGY